MKNLKITRCLPNNQTTIQNLNLIPDLDPNLSRETETSRIQDRPMKNPG